MPLLFEMARLAIERHRPAQLDALRRLRGVIADESREREERFAAARDVLVLLSDMTQQPRLADAGAAGARLCSRRSRCARRAARLRRDPGRLVPIIDACLRAVERGRAGRRRRRVASVDHARRATPRHRATNQARGEKSDPEPRNSLTA